MAICRICLKEFKNIQPHLKFHGIGMLEYNNKYSENISSYNNGLTKYNSKSMKALSNKKLEKKFSESIIDTMTKAAIKRNEWRHRDIECVVCGAKYDNIKSRHRKTCSSKCEQELHRINNSKSFDERFGIEKSKDIRLKMKSNKHWTLKKTKQSVVKSYNQSARTRIKNIKINGSIKLTDIHKQHIRDGVIKSMQENKTKFGKKINKSENKVLKFLKKNFPKKYKYVGGGDFWVGNPPMNPDFLNVNGKKEVIEFNGCFWHGCPKCFPDGGYKKIKNDSIKRIVAYNKYGFRCKVIWEHDLNDNGKLCTIIGGK